MDYLQELRMLGYVAGAMVLGAAIGFERELADKPAGMRTHMLIAGASALLVLLSDMLVAHFGQEFHGQLVRADPIRVIEAILTGVGFLGAGTIIRHGGNSVLGLTTAATVLFTSAVGMCVALEHLLLAVGVTVLVLATLRLLGKFQPRFKGRP